MNLTDKKILVTGAGGFIGGHVVKRLNNMNCLKVVATDIKRLEDWDQVVLVGTNWPSVDLRSQQSAQLLFSQNPAFDVVIHLAADMGGMGFIETHKLDCMKSALMNFNVLDALSINTGKTKVFYSSSACVYPGYIQNQIEPEGTCALREKDAYPADCEDGYGWEKLFTERLCRHYTEETNVECCIGRFHNVYGPLGTWEGGREKAPAALCRKIAIAKLTGKHEIEIWGDGSQLRSFMYIDDCVDGILKLLEHETFLGPVNIGSTELVTINELADEIRRIAGIDALKVNYKLNAPKGVHGRNSDNTLIREKLGWAPSISLREGLEKTYTWIYDQVKNKYNR